MTDKRCGTCKWFKRDGIDYGDCTYPTPVFPSADFVSISRLAQLDTNGTKCPCWEPRT